MHHGGDLTDAMIRFGGTKADWLDVSTGINPHPYPFASTFSPSAWCDLPGKAALEKLLAAARTAYKCPANLQMLAAPGTQILISQLPYLLPEGPVAICGPTYTSHGEAFVRAGRAIEEVTSPYALPDRAKIAVIVNPNNPDGRLVDVQSLLSIAQTLRERGGILVLDEAFADVAPGASVLPHLSADNVVVLRSFGKFFGLAGLRLGFMAASAELVPRMATRLDSWAVSGPALELGTAALADLDWQVAMQRQLADEITDLTLCLGNNGLTVFGGTPLYALAAHPNAVALHEALARQKIWTRVFDYAPTWIRIGLPGSSSALQRLAETLAKISPEIHSQ
ncbi:threonine-phosphate decarboxylase CobD [Roseibium sp.]|uniref:threonine-phosphate decarboxylase CobD n=1 Tax=Roseibium sp. TaxID=1936156 RepID=UPI003A98335A